MQIAHIGKYSRKKYTIKVLPCQIFFDGDVVEVLSLPKYMHRPLRIGDRHYVSVVGELDDGELVYAVGRDAIGMPNGYLRANQLLLYKRPLRNWVKYIDVLIFKTFRQ